MASIAFCRRLAAWHLAALYAAASAAQLPGGGAGVLRRDAPSDASDDFDDDFEVWFGSDVSSRVHLAELQDLEPMTLRSKVSKVPGGEELRAHPFFLLQKEGHEATECSVRRFTYLHDERCGNVGRGPPSGALVVGVGRSGTSFFAKFLQGLGLDVAHDTAKKRGRDGSVSWPHTFRLEECRVPKWSYVVHRFYASGYLMVRNPLKQIRSRANNGRRMPFSSFLQCYSDVGKAPSLEHRDLLGSERFALRHWVLHHTFAKAYVGLAFRVEDVADQPSLMLGMCDVILQNRKGKLPMTQNCTKEQLTFLLGALGQTVNSNHTKKGEEVTWAQLAALDRPYAAMAQQLAKDFGYEVSSSELLPETSGSRRCDWDSKGRWACSLAAPRAGW